MDDIKTNTYIRLFRKFTKWEWYDDANTMRVFLHCLLNANYSDKKWRGILIRRGSFLTSYPKLAQDLKLSKMQIRTALNKLQLTHEITLKTTSQYSIITIKNWSDYQKNNTQDNTKITDEQHTDNTRVTPTNKDNKENKDIYNYNPLIKDNYIKSYSDDFLQKSPSQDSVQKKTKVFVKPTIEEIKQFCVENNKNVDAESFYNFYESKNWMIGKNKMQKWKAAVCTWDRKNKVSKPSEPYKQTVPVYSNEIED